MSSETASAGSGQSPAARRSPGLLAAGCLAAVVVAAGVRLWNALAGPLMWGYDAPGHLAYVFFLDRYGAIPWAHQGWGYFHPPLHYAIGWALAQLGSAEVLLRGLALFGGAASLVTAGLAAAVTRAASPDRPVLPLLAFVAVAFLPVHLYASPMSGNELTCALFGAAALAALIANEGRSRPAPSGDAVTGLLVGLALLSKFNGAVFLAGALAVIALRPLRAGVGDGAWRHAALRAVVVSAAALALAVPYYARNVAEYGTPFRMNRDYPLTAQVEERQEPGSRSWRDFVNLSPRLLVDPRPGAPHLVHSVWGTAYVNAWIDTRSLWNRLSESHSARIRRARIAMLLFGLPPTALALAGVLLAFRDVRRGRRAGVYVPLLVWAALALLAFAIFAVRVPRISALKASYLFGLSLPYGAFVARAIEALGRGGVRPALAVSAVALAAAAAALVYSVGPVHPRREHNGAIGAVYFHMGDYAAARRLYEGRLARAPSSIRWLEGLAAVELAAGEAGRAGELYARAMELDLGDPHRLVRLGVAAALAGDLPGAREHLSAAVARGAGAVARANRGAVLAAVGELEAAEADLRQASSLDPDLAPAWHNLAVVLERSGRVDEAEPLRREWRRAAHAPPRGYPYGVGVGLLHPGMRPLLWLDGDTLRLARAPFREADEVSSSLVRGSSR
jgi:tetratricopeptide (TPR) repeat protein